MPAWLATLLTIVQVVAALGVIILVLIQHGKGADMGAAFGSGSSGSLFGATGSANFLSRTTAALAAVFLWPPWASPSRVTRSRRLRSQSWKVSNRLLEAIFRTRVQLLVATNLLHPATFRSESG